MNRRLAGIGIFLVLVFALAFGSRFVEKRAGVAASTVEAPRFEVDPLWPKPLPNTPPDPTAMSDCCIW